MTNRPHRPTDGQIVARALELLAAGMLPSVLPSALMNEFGLPAEQAGNLASDAIKRHEKKKEPGRRGKLDTKPFDESG